jgi:polyhydroxybutyrate depolymerase
VGIIIVFTTIIFSYLFYQINRANGEITSSGKQRSFLLYVPPAYDPSIPTPLVISFHGYAEWPAHQMDISHWNDMANLHNFLVVYPSGTEFPKHWFTGNQDKNQQDIQFIDDLIDHLQQEYNIDDKRVYANGLSNGGGMAFMLACKRSNRIAAFGGVSGAYLLPWEDCNPERLSQLFYSTAQQTPLFRLEEALPKHLIFPFRSSRSG